MEKVIGIDLGTTYSAVAHVNDKTGRAEIIPDPENQKRITPSVVFFVNEDDVIVGEIAKNNAFFEPGNVVEFFKRGMGKPKVKPPEGWSFTFGGNTYSAQEISAYILKKLKTDAENRLGQAVSKAVITVPAYFGEPQRAATAEAGRIAGLEVLAILDEPVAAALAYGLDRLNRNQTVFVFDLGGGTFDVTIIEIEGQDIIERAVKGNPMLGGKDWDDEIIKYAAREFQNRYDANPLDNLACYQDLQLHAIRAKEELSRMHKSRIAVNYQGNSLMVELTREKFEELTRDLVEECRGLCELVMSEAGRNWADIDTNLLVGGASRMPMITGMLRDISGKEPNTELNPDECVALGAAWNALMLHLNLGTKIKEEWKRTNPELVQVMRDLRVRNITSHNLGVIALNAERKLRSYLLIPKATAVPCEHVDDTYQTAENNQAQVKIEITEGGLYIDSDHCDPAECRVLGSVYIKDIPPQRKGSPIEVTLRFNENKILEAIGRDVLSGKTAREEIHHPGGLSAEELAAATLLLKKTRITS
jgi:molecular chaperone DnaK